MYLCTMGGMFSCIYLFLVGRVEAQVIPTSQCEVLSSYIHMYARSIVSWSTCTCT